MKSFRSLIGVELPIIQAPMAGVQDHRLAVAVCGAGALGSLPAAMFGVEALRDELRRLTAGTSGPYNVNFFCHQPPTFDAQRDARWREALTPYYEEFGIDPETIASSPGRRPFDHDVADVVEEFRPPVVSFHFGLPEPALLARVRSWGAIVLSSATTVDEARWLETRGVEAIIAQGIEAGGHRGKFLSDDLSTQQRTLALVSHIVEAVRLPVIAAGGIADARGLRAALSHGASAVQVGTSYLLCPEATTSVVHRRALSSPAARSTALTNVFSGGPARGIINRLMSELGPMSVLAPQFPLASGAVAPLRAAAEQAGRGDFSPLWAGADATGCRDVSAKAITQELSEGIGT